MCLISGCSGMCLISGCSGMCLISGCSGMCLISGCSGMLLVSGRVLLWELFLWCRQSCGFQFGVLADSVLAVTDMDCSSYSCTSETHVKPSFLHTYLGATILNRNDDNDCIERRNRDFCNGLVVLQTVSNTYCSSGPGAVLCTSRAMCATWYDGTAQLLRFTQFTSHSILALFYWPNS